MFFVLRGVRSNNDLTHVSYTKIFLSLKFTFHVSIMNQVSTRHLQCGQILKLQQQKYIM